jgi:glycerophosphoryl diester phosphodiesterase
MKKIIIALLIMMFTIMSAQTQIIAHRGFGRPIQLRQKNSIQSLKNAQELKIYGRI